MSPPTEADDDGGVCQWLSQKDALARFATEETTQSQKHIKPLHWYIACRLVLEGGFRPDEIKPHPPFRLNPRRELELEYDETAATGKEATILGGLKTKNVDIVVEKPGLGPVLAVSCKGMIGALRNLTNRMEETIGECTNLHITYPALVFGYIFVIRANREVKEATEAIADTLPETAPTTRQLKANDIAIAEGGEPVRSVVRFDSALRELTGRRGIRDDVSRYESVSLALVETLGPKAGTVLSDYPPKGSPLWLGQFFQTLYQKYDERYVYSAPNLSRVTERLEWSRSSQALNDLHRPEGRDYELRLGDE